MKPFATAVGLAALLAMSGCGKVAASVGKAFSHEADNAVAAAAKATADDEARMAASSLGHGVDDSLVGPSAAEQSAESQTPLTDLMVGAGKSIGEEAGNQLAEEGIKSVFSDDDDKN